MVTALLMSMVLMGDVKVEELPEPTQAPVAAKCCEQAPVQKSCCQKSKVRVRKHRVRVRTRVVCRGKCQRVARRTCCK